VSLETINGAVLDPDTEVYAFAESEGQVYSFVDVTFSDGRTGQIYVFTKIDNQLPEIRQFLYKLLVLALLILIVTASVLVGWIYRSIIRPIGSLRIAAQNIRDGNLDFDMDIRNDEMGELAADFDAMRQRLKDSVQEKLEYDAENKQLISNISHDLKTPLTAIKGYVEGIMDGVADTPEKMDKYVRTIYTKANDMDKLIDELTLYSKIDTNRIPYNFVQLDVAEYFEDCAYDLETELTAKGIEFAYFNYVGDDVQVIADPEQLHRVISNIISNSVKYMDKVKGFITLKVSENGENVLIEIEDNGKGIDQKDLPNIFDRFFRADSSRNSAQGGSGIGLAIVKKIVEDHGGRIWATSKEHTGTVMHIELRKHKGGANE
jgi:signal transduction histidine kinase